MKTVDFRPEVTSSKLKENIAKQFGKKINLEKYGREQLEDMRNKLRTRVFQYEGSKGFNDLLHNESYQQDKAMLELLNTRIKEMLGEDIKKLRDKMIELSEGKKGVKVAKHPRGSKGTDQTGDGKSDFDDVQVARMTAGGVPKKKAIAKATGDNVKESEENLPPAKKKETTWTDKSGKKHPATQVQGSRSVAADKAADKERKAGDKVKEAADDRKPAKTKEREVTLPSGAKVKARTVQGWQSQKADKEASKDKNKDLDEAADNCNHTPKGKKCPVHGLKECGGVYENNKKMGKLKESNFKQHVRIVNESLAALLAEDEEGKAKAITAAGDMVNDFTSWMQRVGQYQTKTMIELADAIKADFGTQEAEQFKQSVGPALASALETLTQQREAISQAVAVLAGEASPEMPMGAEPAADMAGPPEPGMEPTTPDAMNPEPASDEFAASDAAAGGAETSGRAMRESKEEKKARKLAEAHSIISKLAK